MTEQDDTAIGAAADDTEFIDEAVRNLPTQAAAYSETDDDVADDDRRLPWRSVIRWAAILLTVTVVTAAGIFLIGVGVKKPKPTPTHAQVGAPVVLDGTYRLDFDMAHATANGSLDPPPADQPQTDNAWAAYRSTCTSTGCVATGTTLDKNNHQIAAAPRSTAEYHFVEKHWSRVPDRVRIQRDKCSVEDDKTVAGSDTEVVTISMEPQPDATLRGLKTFTVVTSECGVQGAVHQDPFVATRVGDVPPGVIIDDPATLSVSPNTSTPAVAGPVLQGNYRLDFDYPNTTHNNGTTNSSTDTRATEWWAFRSLCTASGCVATGAQLDDANREEASGGITVFQFVDGHWQDVPMTLRAPCGQAHGGGKHPAPTDESTVTISRTLQPQPDGALKGAFTVAYLTNECGLQGTVTTTPLVATRVSDAAARVVLADPALFS
jgi:serine/threonine-protein kinase